MINEITVRFSGEQGSGVQYTGRLAADYFTRLGYDIFAINDFESRIRGGYSFVQLRIGTTEGYSIKSTPDICIPFTKSSLDKDLLSISSKTTLFLSTDFMSDALIDYETYSIDFNNVSDKSRLKFVNTFYVSMLAGIFDVDLKVLRGILESTLKKKGEDVVNSNMASAEDGYQYAQSLGLSSRHLTKPANATPQKRACSGSFALSSGAAVSNCKFYSVYPMSPSTSIMDHLAEWSPDFGIMIEQGEDEIAVLNLALGASYAGVRAMVGTSGGGLALMGETVSLAANAELPIVIVNAQRPGPATGLPTRTEQGDLFFSLFMGHGEFSRIILAPGTNEKAFELAQKGFYLADKYQAPVFILVDQHMVDSIKTSTKGIIIAKYQERFIDTSHNNEASYQRYAFTKNGISPRKVPGNGNAPVVADSHAHDESGHMTEEGEVRIKGVKKLLIKKEQILKDITPPYLSTEEATDTVVIGWGSTFGAIHDAVAILENEGVSICHMHYHEVYPLSLDYFSRPYKQIICVENNATAQFAQLLKMEGNIIVDDNILKYDGRPFYLDELLSELRSRVRVR